MPRETLPEQRAYIRGRHALSILEGATIGTIDGKVLVFENSAYISPGNHSVSACLDGGLSGNLKCEDLQFVAEAGHEYEVRGFSRGMMMRSDYLWIEDMQTQRVVAGKKP